VLAPMIVPGIVVAVSLGEVVFVSGLAGTVAGVVLVQVVGTRLKGEKGLQLHIQFMGLKEIHRLKLNKYLMGLEKKKARDRKGRGPSSPKGRCA